MLDRIVRGYCGRTQRVAFATQSFIGRSCLSLASTITIMCNYLQNYVRSISMSAHIDAVQAENKRQYNFSCSTASDRNKRLHRHTSCFVTWSMRTWTHHRCGRWPVGQICVRKCVAIASVRIIGTHCAYGPGEVATKRYSDHNKRPIPSLLATFGARLLSAFV